MSKVEEIERQVASLSEQELTRFRAWFAEFDEQQWDRQLEEDAVNGKLERMAAAARRAHAEDRTRPL